jgi:pyruvate dehydrogenase E2 component (dihydrolipoamide acetyltransferase)
MAEAAGIVLYALHGTGPRGRIVAADVTRAQAHAAPVQAAPVQAAPGPGALSDVQILAMYPEGALVPHSSLRRMIAARLVQASIGVPHFELTIECDIGKMLDARHAFNKTAPGKVSVTDCIVKALAAALQTVPEANATWTEAGMITHRGSDIGVAVAVEGGLIVPLIRGAERKSLPEIATELRDLAARARARSLTAADYEGGSSTVSNLGMDGIRNFSAVLNPPQASILAVGAGEERAVVRAGKIRVATMMTVTLTCDHRVVDGALGARLLAAFRGQIEQPEAMFA